MKKSAKLLALVLALALVLTAFAGCGGTGTSGSAATPASTSGSEPAAGPDISEEVTLTMYLIGGPTKKTLVATGGTVAGVIIAGIAATVFSLATGITGWNVSDIESLLTLASTSGVQVGGLLFSGLLMSSLGAVMDVAMSIGSAIAELHAQNPAISRRDLFKAGMHVGRDMMGTDSNTLILAFAGGSVSMLVLDYAYALPYQQIINSNNIGIAIMQGLSGSFGIVLAVPVTVALAVLLYTWSDPVEKR